MNFAYPYLLGLIPAALWFSAPFFNFVSKIQSKKRTSLALVSPIPISELVSLSSKHSWRVRYGEKFQSILRMASWICLVVALARPQTVETFSRVEMSGRDILFALDVSGSMQALDFMIEGNRVDRLTVLKEVTTKFVADRTGDRMGIVVFGDKVFVQCPLTVDQGAVTSFIDSLAIGMGGSGTAIGDAIIASLKRIKNIPEHSKVIILVTDGKNNSGAVQPDEAAKLAGESNVKIHVVGIGGPEPAPFPVQDVFGFTRYVERPMEYDEHTLQQIATLSGGKYFNAKDTSRLESIYADIDKLEKRSSTSYQSTVVDEYFMTPLLVGACILILAESFGLFVLRRTIE